MNELNAIISAIVVDRHEYLLNLTAETAIQTYNNVAEFDRKSHRGPGM